MLRQQRLPLRLRVGTACDDNVPCDLQQGQQQQQPGGWKSRPSCMPHGMRMPFVSFIWEEEIFGAAIVQSSAVGAAPISHDR